MGCRELIEALRASGEGKVRALRAEAEQQAEQVRAEAARRIEAIRRSHEEARAAEAARQADELLADAAVEARAIRIRAERGLAERLARLARASLTSLRNVGYAGVFASFVQELPRLPWRAVRVNPQDRELARTHFPGAEIETDGAISGGLVAVAEEGRVQMANTFEVRLERSWEDMLPDLMRDVEEAG
jgi:vacuolar-type H+-ATPase subunit E/Vma4